MRLTTVQSQPTPSWAKNIDNQSTKKITEQRQNSKQKNTQIKEQTSQQGNKSDSNSEKLNIEEQKQIQKLKQRDNEVRQHELAHKTTGGQYAGNISYTYQQGPDGNRYAIGGEVSMDIQAEPGDPKKTIEKAETVKRAALAPANPSAQDLKIASKAAQMKMEAKAQLNEEERNPKNPKKLEQTYKEQMKANKSIVSLIA